MVWQSFDFDRHNLSNIFSVIEKLQDSYGKDSILIRRSSGGYGWHIRVYAFESELDSGKALDDRKKMGDCLGRCHGDECRIKGGWEIGRLFSFKNKKEGGKSVGDWMSIRAWKRKYEAEVMVEIDDN